MRLFLQSLKFQVCRAYVIILLFSGLVRVKICEQFKCQGTFNTPMTLFGGLLGLRKVSSFFGLAILTTECVHNWEIGQSLQPSPKFSDSHNTVKTSTSRDWEYIIAQAPLTWSAIAGIIWASTRGSKNLVSIQNIVLIGGREASPSDASAAVTQIYSSSFWLCIEVSETCLQKHGNIG